jgi:insulysin
VIMPQTTTSHMCVKHLSRQFPTATKAFGALIIRQSPNDNRQYDHITLSNGLSALVISDRETKESSCSMNVRVGYFDDPVQLPGLAHFCEHMLFLGTEDYPLEGEYKRYLSQFSGKSNASTSSESTNYFFSVNNEGFAGALDRFASFFTCPLFNVDGVSREVHAVDSEFRRNLQNDSRRSLQTLKLFITKNHPFAKFSTGNMHTLFQNKNAEELQKQVINFYTNTYSAHYMKLVCYGKESVHDLKQMIADRFSNVKRIEASCIGTDNQTQSLFPIDKAVKMVHIVPIKDLKQLHLYWELPSQFDIYDKKVIVYLDYLIEHNGEGSLYQFLKKKGFIHNMNAGAYTESRNFTLYRISFNLTEEGLDQLDFILQSLFAYLRMIESETLSGKSSNIYGPRIFNEVKQLHELSFRWLEKISSTTYISRISKRMQYYPIEDCLYAPYKFTDEFHIELAQEHAKILLSPERMHMQIISKQMPVLFKSHNDSLEMDYNNYLIEPIYNTKYFVKEMPLWLQNRLVDNGQVQTTLSDYNNLHIPASNPFIANDFTIKQEQSDFYNSHLQDTEHNGSTIASSVSLMPPTIINNTNGETELPHMKHKLWYKPISHFNMPLAHVYSLIRLSRDVTENLRGSLLLKLYVSMVLESLVEVGHYANKADLSFEIHPCIEGIEVFVGGFNQHLHKLTSIVFENLFSTSPLDESVFHRVKQLYIQKFKNHLKDQANDQARYSVDMLVKQPFFTYDRILKCLEKLTLLDVQQFFHQTIDGSVTKPQFSLDTFVNGNLDKEQSKNLLEHLHQRIEALESFELLPRDQYATNFIYLLPTYRATVLERLSTNEKDSNGSVCVHFQLGRRTLSSKVKCELLAECIKSYFFDSLRTKQQLGYSIHTIPLFYQCSIAFQFLIQSSSHHPRDVYLRIKQFVEHFGTQILSIDMTDEQFNGYRDALIKNKMKPHTKLLEESHEYWQEIFLSRYHWNRKEDEVHELSVLTKQDMIQFYDEYFLNRETRRELIVLIYPAKDNWSVSQTNWNKYELPDLFDHFETRPDDYLCINESNVSHDVEWFKRKWLTQRFPIE